jgi:adenine phosphoribosyltransferase|tara:strand:- start:144 stop:641 length:498 start_codon:yes stop_codon:yes gene_type:complete
MLRFKDLITEVPDFPVQGVNFKDISPLLANDQVFDECIEGMGEMVEIPDYWVGIDARGFIFASALSVYFGGGVVMCRKFGKLPPPTSNHSYQTEYSNDTLSMHFGSGTAVIVDDVLATGGTIQATNHLVGISGYDVIDNLVLIDLLYVPRVKDFNVKVKSLIEYE